MKNVILSVALVALSGLGSVSASGHGALRDSIGQFVAGFKAETGVAVMLPDGDTLSVNNNRRYPMLSVVKLPLGMAVADMMERRRLPLDTEVEVAKTDLVPDTYSPLRDARPDGGFQMTVEELLNYSLQLSDNNACDILFNLSGGPIATDSYIRNYGKIHDFAITATEDDMHRDTALCRANYTTPLEAARLIDQLQDGTFADTPQLQFVRNTLAGCHTGTERIPKGIDCEAAIIMHKTGTSDCDANGKWTAINDVAHVKMPDGRSYALAVFIKNSYESYAENERTIALISSIVFDYIVGN